MVYRAHDPELARDLAPLGARADHRRRPILAWIDREAVGYTMSDPQALATPR